MRITRKKLRDIIFESIDSELDDEESLHGSLISMRDFVSSDNWLKSNPHVEMPGDEMFDMALKLSKLDISHAIPMIDSMFQSSPKMRNEIIRMTQEVIIREVIEARRKFDEAPYGANASARRIPGVKTNPFGSKDVGKEKERLFKASVKLKNKAKEYERHSRGWADQWRYGSRYPDSLGEGKIRIKRSQLRALIKEMFEEEVEDTRTMEEVLPISTEEYHRMLFGGVDAALELKQYLGTLAWEVAYGEIEMPDRDVERLTQLSREFRNTLNTAYLQFGVDEEDYSGVY